MFGKISNFFVSSYSELKKVIWPSRKQLINHTVMVILSVAISMAIIAAIDYALFVGVEWLIYQY